MLFPFAGRLALVAAAMLLQSGPQIPPPRGLVNDFANVIPAASAARIERVAQDVRDKSHGEIAVVTLADLGGRDVSEVALRIAREWKVGAAAAIGDRTRNAGVVILLVPKETSSDGQGHCRVEVGQGSEGFITDAMSGEICRAATPAFMARDYGTGLELVTLQVAQRYAQEFGFTLDTALEVPAMPVPARRPQQRSSGGINPIFLLILFFIVISMLGGRRGRGGCLPIFIPMGGFGGGGRGGGWGGGGFGGGGGGGFGGFGGGGGFSGGGGGSNW
ncbi:MAG TPA: TPM domain-containing protein [Gemmatimonadaceae bacterium]|nr:TPM domain-containing protein [Gemmatimonadaceae bacterium]